MKARIARLPRGSSADELEAGRPGHGFVCAGERRVPPGCLLAAGSGGLRVSDLPTSLPGSRLPCE